MATFSLVFLVPRVYFCLALGTAEIEPQANADAWIRAFHGAPANIRAKVTMVVNGENCGFGQGDMQTLSVTL